VAVNVPAAPRPFLPRIPDWAFAVGLGGSIVLLLIAIGWVPADDRFTEPWSETETSTEVGMGSYVPLEEARPGEEPPSAAAVAVEEFGHAFAEDGHSLIWGATLTNTHEAFAVRFDLRVSLTGPDFSQEELFFPLMSGETAPGGQVVAGGELFGEIPSDVEATLNVVDLSWYVFEDGEAPVTQESPMSARIDSIEEGADGKSRLFAVTLTNASPYMYHARLQAVFRAADGSLLGTCPAGRLDSLPSGESTRTIVVWAENMPVGADLSLTEFAPAW
jgi:hypothetical protein